MNNLYSFNDTVSRFEGFFPDHRKPGDDMFFNYEWIRESSIHSSSSPTNKIGSFPRKHFASSSSSTCQSSIASGNSASDCVVLRTPKTVPASKQEGVPKTITIPSPNKVSPETDMDIDDKETWILTTRMIACRSEWRLLKRCSLLALLVSSVESLVSLLLTTLPWRVTSLPPPRHRHNLSPLTLCFFYMDSSGMVRCRTWTPCRNTRH